MNSSVTILAAGGASAVAEFFGIKYLDALSISSPPYALDFFIAKYALVAALATAGFCIALTAPPKKAAPASSITKVADISGLLTLPDSTEITQDQLFKLVDTLKVRVRGFGKYIKFSWLTDDEVSAMKGATPNA